MKTKEQPQSPFPENSVLKKYQCPNCHLMVWHEKSEDCKKEQPQEQWKYWCWTCSKWTDVAEHKTMHYTMCQSCKEDRLSRVPAIAHQSIESRARAEEHKKHVDTIRELQAAIESMQKKFSIVLSSETVNDHIWSKSNYVPLNKFWLCTVAEIEEVDDEMIEYAFNPKEQSGGKVQ